MHPAGSRAARAPWYSRNQDPRPKGSLQCPRVEENVRINEHSLRGGETRPKVLRYGEARTERDGGNEDKSSRGREPEGKSSKEEERK